MKITARTSLHLVRLGQPHPETPIFYRSMRYSHDWIAKHWSIDFWRWRLCLIRKNKTTGPAPGRWDVHMWPDEKMVSLRWSIPDANGLYFFTAHYPNTTWGQVAIEGQAKRWNSEGKTPFEFRDYRPATERRA